MEQLEQSIDELHANGHIYCNNELVKHVTKKCKDTSESIIGYSVLEISENVDPEELYTKIDAVHLYGVITGKDEQCGVIQTKLVTKKGVISAKDDDMNEFLSDQQDDDNVIANMNYLKL